MRDVDEVEQPVEADAGTSQGSKVVGPHFHIPRLRNMNTKKPGGRPTPRRTPQASDAGAEVSSFPSACFSGNHKR